MTDTFSAKERSKIMSRVHGKSTRPEIKVRKIVYGLKIRYRLHRKDLAGCPDLVFSSRQKVIFIHGCFWHGHNCRAGQNRPASNTDYWEAKLERNIKRDEVNLRKLSNIGWSSLVLWECELKDIDALTRTIKKFLDL